MVRAMPPRRIVVIASASGTGKTTLARTLAQRVRGTFIEIDALRHLANWRRATPDELRAKLLPLVAGEAWASDGLAGELGDFMLDAADLVVWLDLPPHVWLPRLLLRSARRVFFREELWNGNRETLRDVFWGADAVLPHALRAYFVRRHGIPARVGNRPMVTLRSPREVAEFVAGFPGAREGASAR